MTCESPHAAEYRVELMKTLAALHQVFTKALDTRPASATHMAFPTKWIREMHDMIGMVLLDD